MSTTQYLLNLGLLAYILWANLGTRQITTTRLLLPLVVVAGVAAGFLGHVPTLGNDVALEATLSAAGALLGVLAGLLVSVRRNSEGRLAMQAGAAYAALWVAVIGGRMLFAYGADHWYSRQIGELSMTHRITGADAWTAAFVLMALAMVVTRVAVTAARARAASTSNQAAEVTA
jgi:hypothetical protein